ncbi:GMC family oxidoreductase N-terminal domain-containing protein [Pseudonocardia yunnanensis]|uniref:GMC family oxidoreductase n=1 Tax=Pseudonocardia yunnanensis TaxID=58107 RepID=A0ABW4F1V9_9PSEU
MTSSEEFDYVVVGAGAAGCVVAARLTEDPAVRVLLLEAGGPDDDPIMSVPTGALSTWRGSADWCDSTVPQPQLGGRRIDISAGRVLGGGGTINYTAWCRGHRADYDGWAARGMEGWAWDDVLPYFRRTEDNELGASALHGTGGPIAVTTPKDVDPLSLAFITAGVEHGLPLNRDFNGAELDGVGLLYSNVRDGERSSGAREYLRPALARPNLTLYTGFLVERVVLENGAARGITGQDSQGRDVSYRAGTVVLSAGAIRTPQLLMLSGVGPADHLREQGIEVALDLPGVGGNFQDHPMNMASWPLRRGTTLLEHLESDEAKELYARERRGPLAALVQAAAFIRCTEDAPAPDILATPMLFDMTGGQDPGVTCLVTLLNPQSRGTVRLASADPRAAPLLDPCYLETARDRRTMVAGTRHVLEIFASPTLGASVGPLGVPAATDDAALLDSARELIASMNHPVGTCRAGRDADSVVDPTLRVHGVANLHVIDSSVMPDLPRAFTHAPSVMIGERGFELLREARTGDPGITTRIERSA